MPNNFVGLLGATSLVGQCLLPLLKENRWRVTAFSRKPLQSNDAGHRWVRIRDSGADLLQSRLEIEKIQFWICAAPAWVLPDYFPLLEKMQARRVIVISSTSVFTKRDSSDFKERAVALKLSESENRIRTWARAGRIEWMILRPTLIYGLGRDKNISEIARLIRLFGFFPLWGRAGGLRQPVHAEDIAKACLSALARPAVTDCAYNLPGGEALSYREMVTRIFIALGLRPRLISIPPGLFRPAPALLSLFPRYRGWNTAMTERMNADHVFDHTEALRDLNFDPRKFHLTSKDLPAC